MTDHPCNCLDNECHEALPPGWACRKKAPSSNGSLLTDALSALNMFVAWEDGTHETSHVTQHNNAMAAARAVLLRSSHETPALIEWSETREPDKDCHYTHIIGQTAFGRVLITWKGWKDHDWPTVDESPWGFMSGDSDAESTKRLVENEYNRRLRCAVGSPLETTVPSSKIDRVSNLLREWRGNCNVQHMYVVLNDIKKVLGAEGTTERHPFSSATGTDRAIDRWVDGKPAETDGWKCVTCGHENPRGALRCQNAACTAMTKPLKASCDPYKAKCEGGTGGPCTQPDCEICWPENGTGDQP